MQSVAILHKHLLKLFIFIIFNFNSSFFTDIFHCNIRFSCGFSTISNLLFKCSLNIQTLLNVQKDMMAQKDSAIINNCTERVLHFQLPFTLKIIIIVHWKLSSLFVENYHHYSMKIIIVVRWKLSSLFIENYHHCSLKIIIIVH